MLPRLARVLLVIAGSLLLTALLNLLLAPPAPAQAQPAAPAITPTAAPTITPTITPTPTAWFSATAALTPSAAAANVGDPLTVTAQLVTTGTCGFALYDVTLRQSDPLFAYVAPDDAVIGPPGANPAVWRLTAAEAGVVTFTVDFYGETNCDGVWQWTTIRAAAAPMTVTGAALHLPFAPRYRPPARLTDLGGLGGVYRAAYAINNRGQIAGSSTNAAGRNQAFFWQSGVMTAIGTLGGGSSYALALNERGQVIGESATTGDQESHAFLWANGVMTDIGTLGDRQSRAVGINNQGQVIGNSGDYGFYTERGFLWANGVMTDLGTLGGDVTTVRDINDRGQIVGSSQTAAGITHAFLWENGVMADLDLPVDEYFSEAVAINEHGQVAGTYGVLGSGGAVGFLWENGVVTTFSDQGWYDFQIDDFNERGQAVGYISRDGSTLRAFLWSDGAIIDLRALRMVDFRFCPARINDAGVITLYRSTGGPQGSLLWQNGVLIPLPSLGVDAATCAYAINNAGQIVGQSSSAAAMTQAVLWEIVE